MPMKEGYGKEPKGDNLKDNPKLLEDLGKVSHKGLENIPSIKWIEWEIDTHTFIEGKIPRELLKKLKKIG